MFGWLKGKKKRDLELLETFSQAYAEGEARRKINRAIEGLGLEVNTQEDNIYYVAYTTATLVRQIAIDAIHEVPSSLFNGKYDPIIPGLFVFTISNHISYIVGVSFEQSSTIAGLELFGTEIGGEIGDLADLYNQMSIEGNYIKLLGTLLAKWLEEPKEETYLKLIDIYKQGLEQSIL